ncbi:ABC transporter permease subunit, partial [Klebsiella pneumoniae]|uniref:ABC transporter permease subunit n=2 Tax=Bacteria TaxID=2 RepID=UPI003635E164
VAFLSTMFGTITGLIAGYYKKADFIIMRIIDGMLAFPALLLALALVAALGGSITNIIIALTLAFWPVMTRVVRSTVLQINSIQYVEAAKTTGT